ncbi:MAG: efflux RND transporter permease subunit, partial [Spirochaetota bacterium]
MVRFLTLLHGRPLLVLSVYALMLLYGAAAGSRIPIELLPVLPLPGITVVTTIEGCSAEEIETMVTEPLERGFIGLDGLAGLSSLSEEGISTISLEFALGTDAALCFAETAEVADEVYPRLPEEASKPALSSASRTEEGPLIRVAVEPRGVPFEELAASVDDIL